VRRLFVAVWPPPTLVTRLRGIARPSRPGLRWTTEDQWHVTLRFFGDIDDPAEADLQGHLAEVAAASGPVTASAGPRPVALGREVWVLPVEGLADLAGVVGRATSDIGRPLPSRPFRGHLTLARARRPEGLVGLPVDDVAERWAVDEVTLVSSVLRPDGARYDVVGRWPLGSPS